MSAEMTRQIGERDAALFTSIFDNCNAENVGAMVTDDFEFYHDKWGLTGNTKQQFVDSIAGMCKRIQDGTDFRARRELIQGSMKVYPLNNYGAVETGSHRFYALTPGQPDRLTETAQFTHIWKNEQGVWKLARVISFDHQLAK
ncbi:nuclear transport factor 2 family protein [Permianibacter sp. IMCC34836]|uniref:nuclear transport factor 2 family protein n=1 Tax=Permianibacter fluminis TaxID=2738515 RepID=UPI00155714D9|nr:nuclear transport factor 2 family protein [Permianibacter fluminis]NQD37854.1 nuclear transport factor 2 family protein [Permianibacter fluminis]